MSKETPINYDAITRLEIIDHRKTANPAGRAFVAWNAALTPSVQDNGRTLKIFVTDEVKR
jgi:hypothetical protein